MKLSSTVAGAALAACTGSVCAQSIPAPTDPIIITATRVAQTADETLAPVTVITREDIERRQVRSVPEALRTVPGLSLANSGGPGKLTSVFLRGTEADHVLVLIDGIKVGSATAGTTAFQDIPIDQIERIEIVRGPRSSLYGSEAIGGVIQIFTRRGEGPPAPFFSATGGSHSTFGATAGFSGSTENASYHASVRSFDTEGINACRGSPSFSTGCGLAAPDPDRDGYRNVGGNLSLAYRFETGAEFDVHWLRARGENEFDGSFTDESKTLQETYGTRVRFAPAAFWDVGLRAGRSRDESDGLLDGTFKNRFATRRDTVSWQNDFLVGNQVATIGADYHREQVESSTAFAVTERDNSAVFGQYQVAAGAQRVELSLRRDDNEQFGEHTTGGAAWAYDFSDGPRLRLSYGTAFRAPTFNELFFPGFSNPDLRPEESESVEIGLVGRRQRFDWSVSLFKTDVENLIGLDPTFTPINVDSARIRGLETALAIPWHAWTVTASLTLLDAESRSPDATLGNDLPRRAHRILDLDLRRDFARYRLGLALHAEGPRFDDLANERRVGGFALVDLRGEYDLTESWSLQAQVSNLFDKDYETIMFFNQPGRELFVTLRYDPRRSFF